MRAGLTSRFEAWTTGLFDGRAPRLLLPALAVSYFVFWTALLAIGKRAQPIHFDSAEAYAWGQQLAWGYGKHPPVSGAIAWAWFSIFPATDFSMYALAMAVTGASFALLWMLARRIVNRERALFATALLLVYPILNFKGYKYNADLALMPFVVLVVLVFTIAFERRTWQWGVALGLAGAAAVLTKYWGGWAIAAVGIAALLDPDRKAFFRSPVVYVAGVVFIAALVPHVLWLVRDDFEPFRYAAAYSGVTRAVAFRRALGGSAQAIVLLAPVALAAAFALWPKLKPAKNAEPTPAPVRQLWIIVAVLALAPPVTAALLAIRMKSDWAIPMYTMVPLAFAAWPRITVPMRAVARAAAAAAVFCLGAALIVPLSDTLKHRFDKRALLPKPFDEAALRITAIWHQRFGTAVPVVAGMIPFAAPITFYSPDHPRLFSEADAKLSPWIDTAALPRTGFVGVCAQGDDDCLRRVGTLQPSAERIELDVERKAFGRIVSDKWIVLLAAPQRQ